MKFAIGTAQFIKKYGILKKQLKINELENILRSFNKKINLVDTAPSYDNAEEIIGQNKNRKLKIATKIDYINSNSDRIIKDKVTKSLINSLKKLKTSNIYCLYLHDERDIQILKKKKLNFFLTV